MEHILKINNFNNTILITVLFIAAEFPPVNSTGCYRYIKFLKHLNKFNIEPIVIVPRFENLKKLYSNNKVDYSLLQNLPEEIKIIEIPFSKDIQYNIKNNSYLMKIKNFFYFTDEISAAWQKNLMNKLPDIIKLYKPDIIFSSVPPFSISFLVTKISKKLKKPLVIDFRDEMSLNKGTPFKTFFHYLFAHYLEKKVFIHAKKIITVTPQLSEFFKKAHSNIEKNKFNIITNGFDSDEISFNSFSFSKDIHHDSINIGYSGSFYYNPTVQEIHVNSFKRKGIKKISYSQKITKEDWSYRGPEYFLKTLSRVFEISPELRKIVKFHHIGHIETWVYNLVNQYGLKDNFIAHGFLTKEDNINLQKSFDALLATSEKVIGGEHYCLSSKLFDYIQLQKPILGFVTKGITKSFIENSCCGIIFNPDNIEDSAMKLRNFFLSRHIEYHPNETYLKNFKSLNLSEQLAKIFTEIHNQENCF